MFQSKTNFKDYLKKLKKNELINIINDYNYICEVYNYSKIDDIKSKKEVLVSLINDVKDNYYKAIIMSLDKNDYKTLIKIFKKNSKEILDSNKELVNYLNNKYILWQNEVPCDINLKDILKDKTISKHISYWDKVYKFVDGIVIAYGVVDLKYFNKLIENVKEKDDVLAKINLYYKKDYVINDEYIVSKKLTNKKRIASYSKDKKYKEFTTGDFIDLGSCLYHHKFKSYKKFIKMLKNYYVFKNKDINFVDENVIMPYLYNKINEEETAKNTLEDTVVKFFEFKSERLKKKMLKEIDNIKMEFPLWELRGFSKKERDNK